MIKMMQSGHDGCLKYGFQVCRVYFRRYFFNSASDNGDNGEFAFSKADIKQIRTKIMQVGHDGCQNNGF